MAGTQSPSLNAPFTPDAAVFCKPGECQKLWTALQNGGKRREFGNWFQQSTQKLSEKVLNGNLSGKDVTVFVNYMCLSGKIVRAVSKASKDVNVQISAAYSFAVDTERENGSDELAMGCSYPGKPFPCGIVEANLLSDVMANNHLLTERDAFIRIQEKSVTRGQCFVSATQRRRAHAKRNEHAPNIDNFSDRFSARSQSSVVVNGGDSTATRRCLTAKRTRSDDRVESEMELHSTESRDVEGLKETILNGHDFYERVKRIKQETGLEADLQDSEAHYMVVTEGNEGRPEEDDGETSSLEDDQAMDGNESCLSETDAFMHTASVNHSANDSEEMGANSSGGEDNFSGRDVTPETSGMGQCDLNNEADFTESAGPSPLSATMKTPEGAVEDDVEPPSPNPANGEIDDVIEITPAPHRMLPHKGGQKTIVRSVLKPTLKPDRVKPKKKMMKKKTLMQTVTSRNPERKKCSSDEEHQSQGSGERRKQKAKKVITQQHQVTAKQPSKSVQCRGQLHPINTLKAPIQSPGALPHDNANISIPIDEMDVTQVIEFESNCVPGNETASVTSVANKMKRLEERLDHLKNENKELKQQNAALYMLVPETEMMPRPKAGVLSKTVAEAFQMLELVPGSRVFLYQDQIRIAESKLQKNGTCTALYLLTCFYTKDELIGKNLTGANQKASINSQITNAIIGYCVKAPVKNSDAEIKLAIRNRISSMTSIKKKKLLEKCARESPTQFSTRTENSQLESQRRLYGRMNGFTDQLNQSVPTN
ncbi:uncharacterized protein [Ptychodera flava]|uniref:uncharacterized protein isoform X2 n=1 Tax=Ptychodera flava TaxID=63121 RepID=UPI00396A3236